MKTIIYSSDNEVKVTRSSPKRVIKDSEIPESCFAYSFSEDASNSEYVRRNKETAIRLLSLMKNRRTSVTPSS